MKLEPSAHRDTFPRDSLPPFDQWPEIDLKATPEIAAYPKRMNIAVELLDKNIAAHGDRPVLWYGDGHWTYKDLQNKVNQIAHVLVDDFGIVPGNRVMIRGFNHPMFVACWFAIMKVGGVCVATMPLYRNRELTYMADFAKIGLALCDKRLSEEMELTSDKSTGLKTICYYLGEGPDSLEARMAKMPTTFIAVDTSADDVCLIAFTSGTTGPAKGCMHFHRDLMAINDTFARYVLKPTKEDIFTGSPPIAFTFGLGAVVTFPMSVGASTVMVEQYNPQKTLETIQAKRVSVLFTAPTAYRAMTGMVKSYDISSLKKCVSAGETLPLTTWQGWYDATGIKIIDGLGSTEMLHIFVATAGDDIKPGATGKAIPGYQAKVFDDDGKECPPGTVGRLAVKGPTGVRYMSNPERQKAYSQNGWNFTGDAYKMDDEGYFIYQARTDDMIISAGYNISGAEVENVVMLHPKVMECACIAAADGQRGNIVKAFVVLRDKANATPETVKELQDYVKSEIAPYKYPRAVEFIDALPRTQTGKVQRNVLRAQEAEKTKA